MSMIPETDSVGYGGSASVDALGIKEKLRARGQKIFDRDLAETPEERMSAMRMSLTADTFLTGTNAVTKNGELVNVDANGNRVAAMSFGPKSVIVVCGINKLADSLDEAVFRARHTAAPVNAQRFGGETPCTATGFCGDCTAKDCICSYIVETRLCRPEGRIKVVVVGESLGF